MNLMVLDRCLCWHRVNGSTAGGTRHRAGGGTLRAPPCISLSPLRRSAPAVAGPFRCLASSTRFLISSHRFLRVSYRFSTSAFLLLRNLTQTKRLTFSETCSCRTPVGSPARGPSRTFHLPALSLTVATTEHPGGENTGFTGAGAASPSFTRVLPAPSTRYSTRYEDKCAQAANEDISRW